MYLYLWLGFEAHLHHRAIILLLLPYTAINLVLWMSDTSVWCKEMFVPSNTLYACPSVLYFNLILIYGEDALVRLYCHVLGGSHPIVVLVDLPPVATAEGESSSEEEEEEEERPTNSRTSSTESSQLFSVFSTLSTRQPSTRQGKAGGGPGGQQLLLHCQQTCERTT